MDTLCVIWVATPIYSTGHVNSVYRTLSSHNVSIMDAEGFEPTMPKRVGYSHLSVLFCSTHPLAIPTGLEPAASTVTGLRSIQLNYEIVLSSMYPSEFSHFSIASLSDIFAYSAIISPRMLFISIRSISVLSPSSLTNCH